MFKNYLFCNSQLPWEKFLEKLPSITPSYTRSVRSYAVMIVLGFQCSFKLYPEIPVELRVCPREDQADVTHATVKPVYNGPVYSSHPVYHGHLTTFPKSCLIFIVKLTCR